MSTYTKLNTHLVSEAQTWSSCRLRFSSSRLSALLKCNVCWIQRKKIVFTEVIPIVTTWAITTKGLRAETSLPATVHKSSAHTCVTTTQAIFPYPLSPAPLVIMECVSHLSHSHRASVSRCSLQSANSPHWILLWFQDSSTTLSKKGDCLNCSSSLHSLVLSICRILCSIQRQTVQLPQQSQPVDR